MMNSGVNSSFKIYPQQVSSAQQAQQNPFLQLPLVPIQHQQQMMYDVNPQQQQTQFLQTHQLSQQHQQHDQYNRNTSMSIQHQFNAMSLVSGSQMGDGDSGDSEGDSQVLHNNPEQVRQFFEEFLKNTQAIDSSHIQLSTVSDQYNISFKELPSDEEMKMEFNRMISKYNSSSQKGQKKNWNDNETKILCWIVIKASALQDLDCRAIEDKIWDDIAKMMIGRTSESCKFKWLSLSKLNLQQIPWSTEEDAMLLQIIKEFNSSNKGNKWSEISKELNSRSKKNVFRQGKQCRERWNNHLDPAINREPWQDKEDLKLLNLIIEKGKKWSDVSKELRSNRTENNVKNRFNSIIKKEKQALEEMHKNKMATEISPSSSEIEIIHYLIKKYNSRISNGFPLHCKEEESANAGYGNQNSSNGNLFQPYAQQQLLKVNDLSNKGESPVTKIEIQKNKLKDLIHSELKTKESSQQLQPQPQSSMNLEPQLTSENQQIRQPSDQQQQQQQQQIQQPFGYQNYFQPHQFLANTDQFSQTGFKPGYMQSGLEQNSMSPNGSQQGMQMDPHSMQHHQPYQQLPNMNGATMHQSSASTTASQTHPLIQLFSANPSYQSQPQQQSVAQQQQQQQQQGQYGTMPTNQGPQKDLQGTFKLSLAFFNPLTQELIEVDQQLLEEYTSQQVRIQLNQYSQNLKTPQQTPSQTPQNTFHMMMQSISSQIAQQQQQGSNSPQYNTHLYQGTPNGFSQQPFMGIMGTPISPQTNLFGILPNLSPSGQGGASGFNTPNDINMNGIQDNQNIRSINQMQQYANFFRMNNPRQESDQNGVQQPQQNYTMYMNNNTNSNQTRDTNSPQTQNATTSHQFYLP